MRFLMKQLAATILSALVVLSMVSIFFGLYLKIGEQTVPKNIDVIVEDNQELSQKEKPILVVKSGFINLNEPFNYKEYVKAYTPKGKDISEFVTILKGQVDTKTKGAYTVTYKCTYDKVSSYNDATYIVD